MNLPRGTLKSIRPVEIVLCPSCKPLTKMEIVPLDAQWQLAIRSLIRSEFVDAKCTRNVAWHLGCMLVKPESPRLVGVCLVDADGYLRYLVLRAEARGQGWGTRMLQHALPSISTLTCIPERIHFYERNGFVLQGPDSRHHGMMRLVKRETNEELSKIAQVAGP